MNGIQMGALRRMFGADVKVIEQTGWLGNAEQIVEAYNKGGFDDVIIVAPLSVISRVIELGVHPLWSEAVICSREQKDWETNGRFYRFARFRRIRRLALEFDDLGPNAVRQTTDTAGGQSTESSRRYQAATIPSQVLRDQGRGHISREVMEKIRQISRESEASELLYLSPGQRDRGGDQLHPNCRVYSLPGRVKMATEEKPWYHGDPQPEGQVYFGTHLIVDPGTLSVDEVVSLTVSHFATIEMEAGMVKSLVCSEGTHKGARLGQVQFGQKSETRLLSADGTVIGWGIMPLASHPSGKWTGTIQLRLFHEPYPVAKMIRL